MHLIDWAFEQDLPTAEKLVLVYLASKASADGVGLMDRPALAAATGYKPRSIQRLLKSLRDSGEFREAGHWYFLGYVCDPDSDLEKQLLELPEDMRPALPGTHHVEASPDHLQINVDTEAIAQTTADCVIAQFENFEMRMDQRLERLIQNTGPAAEDVNIESVDPVYENPLYDELLRMGQAPHRAYALSKADLALADEIDHEPFVPPGANALPTYSDGPVGRLDRITDIFKAGEFSHADFTAWQELEAQENKHTVSGEVDGFELIYPAIVAAAQANVGKMTLAEFINPRAALRGDAPWDREINAPDKDSPTLMQEISEMLLELEQAHDPRCEVQPRTQETGEDNVVRTETLLGYHRRVSAKYREMKQLQQMGVI